MTRDQIELGARDRLKRISFLLRWIALGAFVGTLSGATSAAFLISLKSATRSFADHGWLLYLLPLTGLLIGLAYHYGGGRSAEGNNLIIGEIHDPQAWVPRRMAPMVFVGSIASHLTGASVGREGAAIQMAGSVTDLASRILRLKPADRRIMLIAAIAGGFGSIFGVPLAGAVFALEVQAVGRVRYDALVPALAASVVGDEVVVAIGVHHTVTPELKAVGLSAGMISKVALAGIVFGLISIAFTRSIEIVKRAFTDKIRWAPLRPFFGGLCIVAMTAVAGTRDYNGLSLGLIERSLFDTGLPSWAFLIKLAFTAVALGAGFIGGEVTPQFVIGATLGATLAGVLGVPVPLLAAIGFVALFAGAANTPLACTIMGAELFGAGALPYFAIACVLSYVFSSHRGLFTTQLVDQHKGPRHDQPRPEFGG